MSANFESNVKALMDGIESHLSVKTIIGEPVRTGDMLIFPMADVSFGVCAGSFEQDKKTNGGGGVGAKMQPAAVMIVQNGTSKIVNIKDKSSINKLIEMIPDFINKLSDGLSRQGGAEQESDGEELCGEAAAPSEPTDSE